MKKRLTALLCVLALLASVGVYASAAEAGEEANTYVEAVGEGEYAESRDDVSAGDYVEAARCSGGSYVEKFNSQEEMDSSAFGPETQGSMKPWTKELSGTSMCLEMNLTNGYQYMKFWIRNDGTKNIQFNLTKGSPTGPIDDNSSRTIYPGDSRVIYTNAPKTGKYYLNLTCGSENMKGIVSSRIASSIANLDVY